jgi:hypothetical protein
MLPFISLLVGCATNLPWPDADLAAHQATSNIAGSTGRSAALTRAAAINQIVGHYAHYDIVSYEEPTKNPMRTFIISYGFTDFYLEGDQLIEQDRFCHAEQKINYKSVQSSFNDTATQAIQPKPKAVELSFDDGVWNIYRPATPTLLGISGDASQPISRDNNDPNIVDADNDGKPGVTVDLVIGGFLKGEIYIIRREIFENYLTLQNDGRLTGHVKDSSEQFVLGASMKMLLKSTEPFQVADTSMNPLILVKIDDELIECDELMARRDEWFPQEPAFY